MRQLICIVGWPRWTETTTDCTTRHRHTFFGQLWWPINIRCESKLILQAMKKHGAKRLIATASPSATDPHDPFDLIFKLAVLMIKLFILSAYQDIVKTAEVIRATDLDWTIVRLPLLNSKPKQGRVNAGYIGEGQVNLSLSRADLADFLLAQLDQLEDDTFIQKAPAISN